MKNLLLASALTLSLTTQANTYRDAITFLKNAPQSINDVMDSAPDTYNFQSQFGGSSSVNYTGQVFRQVLLLDLKTTMSSQPRGIFFGPVNEAKNMLMSYYAYDENPADYTFGMIDGFTEFTFKAKSPNNTYMSLSEGYVYSDIQSPGKNLQSKIAGIDNPLRRGKLFGTTKATTPDGYINWLFDQYAENLVNGKSFKVPNGNLAPQTINGAHITEEGLELAQLTQKFIHGAVAYSQAARDYLSTDLGAEKGLNATNETPAEQGAAYTSLEHHFDEAFGYFGAARDYKNYSDTQLNDKLSIDTDNDGYISVLTELNTGMATNFARMDLTAVDQNMDLAGTAINAFLKGRFLITQKPAGYRPYVVAQAKVALGAWERAFAAVITHYINATLGEYDSYGTGQYLFKNFVKYWSEMKGFSFAFQFNPNGTMDDSTFDELHRLLGEAPVLPHADAASVSAYKARLLQARDLLKTTYEFTDNNVANW